ncbi:MAG: glycosyltransferase family 2 protein, partial [Actinomycetota bacterium]
MLDATMDFIGVLVLVYFFALSVIYAAFTAIAWRSLTKHLRRRRSDTGMQASSPLTPPITVVLPAYNEEAGIVESVRSLLALRYPTHEVVVINDGSTDDTMQVLTDEFDLAPVRKPLRTALPTAPVKGVYVSRRDPDLWVVDKANGGKADALNCGINAARFPYLCAIDADALIEPDALLQVAKPILDRPELVAATGGIVRIANGCRIEDGRVLEVGAPSNPLAVLQVVEYFRAFLVGRMAWARLNS